MTIGDCGILLTNIGSPDAPTPSAVRRYLKNFLSDPRVVEIPRFIWWPILHGIILRTRPQRSAHLYQQIWTEDGSPLVHFSKQLAHQLEAELNRPVAIGMRYGNPSLQDALEKFQTSKIKKILILPLFPQYSATSTASAFDHITTLLKKWRHLPEITFASHYHHHEKYIEALCETIQQQPTKIKHLLFSFHGIPQRCIDRGDPYAEQCHETARLVTEKLQWPKEKWSIAFQSRLGRAQWLKPYTDQVLQELPQRGITDLHVICPGFAVDCLETLEEIAIRGKQQFLNAGGKTFHYIPALNAQDVHLALLKDLIRHAASAPRPF